MKKIDFHAHYISPGYRQFLDDYFGGRGDGVPTPTFSVDTHLKTMKKMDIDYSVISISSPHISAAPDEVMKSLAQEVNDYAAQLSKQYSDQIGFFATLPLPLVDESIKVIDQALDQQHATGFTLPTNARGIYLGDEQLDPILNKLNERHAVVAIHPNEPKPSIYAMKENILPPLMEFLFDTTRTIIFMSQKSVFSKYPNIKWIVPHGGALLPVIAQRINLGNKMLSPDIEFDDLDQVMQSLYFDIAGKVIPYQLQNILQCVDHSKIIYGSDAPYTTDQVVELLANEFENTDIISDDLKADILYNNAFNVLPNLKK